MSISSPPVSQIALRSALALLGGYCFVRSLCAAGIAALVCLGTNYEGAWMLAMMSAFLVFLGVVLWVFSARRLLPVVGVLVGGSVLLAGAAHGLVAHLAAH